MHLGGKANCLPHLDWPSIFYLSLECQQVTPGQLLGLNRRAGITRRQNPLVGPYQECDQERRLLRVQVLKMRLVLPYQRLAHQQYGVDFCGS